MLLKLFDEGLSFICMVRLRSLWAYLGITVAPTRAFPSPDPQDHSQQDRIILPLLTTLDLLFKHNVFTAPCPAPPPQHSFPPPKDVYTYTPHDLYTELPARLQREAQSSRDVRKLLACLSVAIHLLTPAGLEREGSVSGGERKEPMWGTQGKQCVSESGERERGEVLSLLMGLLGHSFPRVRKSTAEQIYMKVLVEGPGMLGVAEEAGEALMAILSETVWDVEEREEVCGARDQVCRLLGVDRPMEGMGAGRKGKGKARRATSGEFASYRSLVKEIGY